MSDAVVFEDPGGLSQTERVIDTFIAPSKTFHDILRSTSWWLPFLLAVIVSMGSAFAMQQKIGFERIAGQAMQENSSAADQLAQLTPEQRARQMHITAAIYQYSTYGAGVFVLLITAFGALVNWASFNFGLGADSTYGQMFAVWMYASLPRLLMGLLNIVLIYAGVNTENFDLKNPVGTNIGYYLQDSPVWLRTALGFLDLFSLWSLVLMILGCSIVARKSKGQAAAVVVGWWLVLVLVYTGVTAATS